MQILCRTASRRSHTASHSRLSPEGTRIYQTPTASSEGAQLAVGVRDGDENKQNQVYGFNEKFSIWVLISYRNWECSFDKRMYCKWWFRQRNDFRFTVARVNNQRNRIKDKMNGLHPPDNLRFWVGLNVFFKGSVNRTVSRLCFLFFASYLCADFISAYK